MAIIAFHDRDRTADICQGKALGAIIQPVFFRLSAVQGDADRVQTGLGQMIDCLRQAAVGVEINRTPARFASG